MRSSAQIIDSFAVAYYKIMSKNYIEALGIYNRHKSEMSKYDQFQEIFCFYKLKQTDSVCRLKNLYSFPIIDLQEICFGKDENFLSDCKQTIKSDNDYNSCDVSLFHLFQLDQLIRTTSYIDSATFDFFEFFYIQNGINQVIDSLVKKPSLSIRSLVYFHVILLHQCRKPNFYARNIENLKKLFEKKLITTYQYAIYVDNYYFYNFHKQVYGTWWVNDGDRCTIEVYDPENIDKKRALIGLPEFSFEPMLSKNGVIFPIWYNDKK